ncbi:hypothetical protein BH23BAC3_BH23BAC3_07860 [soil metagenome]
MAFLKVHYLIENHVFEAVTVWSISLEIVLLRNQGNILVVVLTPY